MEQFNPLLKFDSENFAKIIPTNEIISSAEEDGYTYLHIRYFATHEELVNDYSWINISTESFLYKKGAGVYLKLLHAINVPILPERHYFYSPNDSLDFILIFPPIPKSWSIFDFVENQEEQLLLTEQGFENSFGIYMNNITRNDTGIYRIEIKY